jgi:hypothetical protein
MLPAGTSRPTAASINSPSNRSKPCTGKIIPDARLAGQTRPPAAWLFSGLLAGLGLGIFVPASNTVIMRATADSSASLPGGLVNMARGIGTTLGISLIALALHLGSPDKSGHGYAESAQARPAFILLTVVSAVAAAIALAGRRAGAG